MSFFDTTWYVNFGNGTSTGYYAVPVWAVSTAYTVGQFVRQLTTPTIGYERLFVCVVAGTSNSTEPAWSSTLIARGAKVTDNTVTWMECTGMAGTNGDLTNCPIWVASRALTLGEVYYDSVSSSLQICTTAGTSKTGAAPTFSATAGTTTTDNTVTWTSLGPTSNFTTTVWSYPHARIGNVFATNIVAANNTVYISNNHAETQAATMTWSCSLGTGATPLKILCVNSASAPPTATATTATVTTTGAFSLGISIYFAYFYGITFSAGTGSTGESIGINGSGQNTYDTCKFNMPTTASSIFYFGVNYGANITNWLFNNCTFTFGSTGDALTYFSTAGYSVTYSGCTFAATGSVPTQLNSFSTGAPPIPVTFRDCNLSAITGNLGLGSYGQCSVLNCQLGSGVTIQSQIPYQQANCYIKVHNSDSASTNYRYYYSTYQGVVIQETTIVRSGGASNGTTSMSWNITSNTNANYYMPFVTEEIAQWNSLVGSSRTATLYLTSNIALTNGMVWAEIEYPTSSSYPLGSSINNKSVVLATPTALTTDASVWGGSTTYKYSIALSFTPQMAGPIKARVYVGNNDTATTVYLDPVIYIV